MVYEFFIIGNSYHGSYLVNGFVKCRVTCWSPFVQIKYFLESGGKISDASATKIVSKIENLSSREEFLKSSKTHPLEDNFWSYGLKI